MLLIRCPCCDEDRPEIEFRYAGEAHLVRASDPSALSDEEWSSFLYFRRNPKGWHAERWHHVHGCGQLFNALRHTVTDRIAITYAAGAPRPDLPSDATPEGSKA